VTVVVLVGAAVVVLVVILVLARNRRTPDGVATFQRQIDALSPEARRPTVRRVEDATRRDEWTDEPDGDADGDPREGGADGA
jgi:hypothetical protein